MEYVLLNAASWAISVYFAYQRTWKPFNPILGETYEMVNHNGISFIAEQVLLFTDQPSSICYLIKYYVCKIIVCFHLFFS